MVFTFFWYIIQENQIREDEQPEKFENRKKEQPEKNSRKRTAGKEQPEKNSRKRTEHIEKTCNSQAKCGCARRGENKEQIILTFALDVLSFFFICFCYNKITWIADRI